MTATAAYDAYRERLFATVLRSTRDADLADDIVQDAFLELVRAGQRGDIPDNELAWLHQLPPAARPLLEVAALLHDIGHAVNYQRHHKHTHYLIQNLDIPGLSERERSLVGAIARFHRRSRPDPRHEVLKDFNAAEVRVVRRCVALLRVADSLDRSHHQPVQQLQVSSRGPRVRLKVKSRQSIDLELWDLEHEVDFFHEVFGKTLVVAGF